MSPKKKILATLLACGLLAASGAFAQQPALEAPAAPRFTIQSFAVEGNTLLPQAEVDRLVAPYLGPNRDFGSVQQALEALTDAYVGLGYNAVRVLVPEQDLVGGRVRLQVIEARVRNVKVQGNQFFDESNVRASVPSLRQGEVPNTRSIGQSLAIANENPAKQTTVVMEQTDTPGQADAIVRVADNDPKRITLSLDNTGTPQTGMLRTGIGYQNANLTNRDDVLSLQFVTSPTKVNDVRIFGAGYRLPLYRWNGALDLFGGYSDVSSGTVQGLFTVAGSGTILGARYTQTLPNVDLYQHKVAVGLDYRAFKSEVLLIGTTATLVPDVTTHPVSLTYSGRYSPTGSDLAFSASLSQNLAGGNDGDQQAFAAQRVGARAEYRIVRLAAGWTRVLPEDFLLRLSGNMQFASHPLVPGEQFGLGGQDSVRGFYEREASNDGGERFSAEVYGPEWGGKLGDGWRFRALAFYDTASGRDKDPERTGHNALSSVGVGVRISQGRSFSFRADAGRVFNRSATRPDNDGRIHFTVSYSF